MVEPLNHVHYLIEPSALDVSNASESNIAVIDSSSGIQSSAQSSIQLPSVQLPFKLPSVQLPSVQLHLRNCNSSTSSSTTTTYSTIIPSDKNVLMTDEAMITAIAEFAFAESKSSPPSFRYPVIPNLPSSSFPSPPLSERSSNQSSLQLLTLRFLLKALLIHP
ncbi:hypothetical protein F8M41_009247 [Gigaspora margarita]|uniref:Uncharacterized protein n=1 Tax=Gigaspora margarita TaxID=4874 RepID=A0A8H3X3Y4_GIGMA|nr:hypothetical protein F8M41_009247 [Gigaspora margarita]